MQVISGFRWIIGAGLLLLGMFAMADTVAVPSIAVFPPDVPVFKGVPMVPAQPLLELLGLEEVQWDIHTLHGTISRQEHRFTFQLGSLQASQNGQPVTLPLAPFERVAVDYLPLMPLVEALGGAVTLDEKQNEAAIALPGVADLHLPLVRMDMLPDDFRDYAAQLYACVPDGRQMHRLTYSVRDQEMPSISPDGTMIAMIRSGALYVRPLSGGTEIRLVAAESTMYPYHPLFAADNKTVYFTAVQHDRDQLTGVCVQRIALDGTPRQSIINGVGECCSPDGALLAYSEIRKSGEPVINILNLATLATEAVGPGYYPSFSPDGQYLLFVKRYGFPEKDTPFYSPALYALKDRVVADLPVVDPGSNCAKPTFSPDGAKILYCSGGEAIVLLTEHFQHAECQQLPRWGSAPTFARDGGIVFVDGGKLITRGITPNANEEDLRLPVQDDMRVYDLTLLPLAPQMLLLIQPERNAFGFLRRKEPPAKTK